MPKWIRLFVLLFCCAYGSNAQTAKVYRGGVLLSTYSTAAAASAAANMIGDSIVLSAHTFYEHDVPMIGGQIWQGTITPTDTTTIDAEAKGRIGLSVVTKSRAYVIRDIICQNGSTIFSSSKYGGSFASNDSLVLKGHTIIRFCYAENGGGGVHNAIAYDWVKITHNRADSSGGGVSNTIIAYDSVEISYNSAPYGGGVGALLGGSIGTSSPGVRIHHNIASIAGGGVFGSIGMTAGQITDNQAPIGAAFYTWGGMFPILQNMRIYNPSPSGKRQNEIYIRDGIVNTQGTWFGRSDTIGVYQVNPKGTYYYDAIKGKYAVANWSINWGKLLGKKDTLFPIGASFTYNDGTALPANACPWLVGHFSSSMGTVLNPTLRVSATDTMSSMFRTYIYAKGDTGAKAINYLCVVDADTFRATKMVWGIDTVKKLSLVPYVDEHQEVMLYPNPILDYLHLESINPIGAIRIIDSKGQTVLEANIPSNKHSLEVSSLPKGVYWIIITGTDGVAGTAQLLKQ